ncbi:hypothetical protein COY62_01990 [bacterium (Candidatus Howlettbacteria) CG_4_10_14_0_8_um_filter_40_9]|nr:MAG: hypothetical protein COY62_01990 [bacterium (Candidatus Howlettbacteria) CG_4_10_14_0_8_um_filter_40_9]
MDSYKNEDSRLEKLKTNPLEPTDLSVISIEECKKYLDKFELSDEKIIEIQNYLIGIINKSINLYLDDFK